jgi:putative membrane protein
VISCSPASPITSPTALRRRARADGVFHPLASHIILAAVSLPFILFTFIAGWTNRFAAHKRLARWVFPIWLYVALTGPVCYWMLRPFYP